MVSYSHESEHYNIPSPGIGDVVSPNDEQTKAGIIDTQLYGSILAHSSGHGSLNEGNWSSSFSTDDSSVTLANNGTLSFRGFISQVFIDTISSLSWTGLQDNTTYYLFVTTTETDTTSSKEAGDATTYVSTSSTPPANGLLVAKATTTDSQIVLDTSPVGKIKIYTVADHAALSNDPHGQILEQSYILSSGIEVTDKLETRDLIVYRNLRVDGDIIYNGDTVLDNLTVNSLFTCSGISVFSGTSIFYDNVTVRQEFVTSGLTVADRTTFRENVECTSGVGVDGVDLSEAKFLTDGSNADWDGSKGHTHDSTSGLGIKTISFWPVYKNTVSYNAENGTLSNGYADSTWTHEYNCSVVPDDASLGSDIWTWGGDNKHTSVSGSIVTVSTDDAASDDNSYYRRNSNNFNNSVGWVAEIRLKVTVSNATGTAIQFEVQDGTRLTVLYLGETFIKLSQTGDIYNMDTTDGFHVYRMTRKGLDISVYVDGVLRISGNTSSHASVLDRVFWGDGSHP